MYLIGADIGRVPRQDMLLDQGRQVDAEVVVAAAIPFRAFRRVASQVEEVADVDDRLHCLACPGEDADDPAPAEVRVEVQLGQVPFPRNGTS